MARFLKDINLKGRVAIVTGATKGIGRSTAIALHQVGASIIAIGRNKNELKSLKKKLKPAFLFILIIFKPGLVLDFIII